jgi:hypothetical protein
LSLLPGTDQAPSLCKWDSAGGHSGDDVLVRVGCVNQHMAEAWCCAGHLGMLRTAAATPAVEATCNFCGAHRVMYLVAGTGEVIQFG